MYTLDDVIDLWNHRVVGCHKTVRIKSRFKTPDFIKKFDEAKKELPTLKDWECIINESLRVFDDPWWECRRLKQGFNWLFQKRCKGEGEVNWIHFYELAMDRAESEGSKKELMNNLFSIDNNTEVLP